MPSRLLSPLRSKPAHEPMAEIILVRSLTNSDLGIFAAHRSSASSKQRAININAPAAARLLSSDLYNNGGCLLDCIVTFDDLTERSPRIVGKTHKNWRLGGNKIEGLSFAQLDSADFMLLRSPAHNDGSSPISVTFIARATNAPLHAKVSGLVAFRLIGSMTVYDENDKDYATIADAALAPPRPAATPQSRKQTPVATPLVVAPMPSPTRATAPRVRTIKEKLRAPGIVDQMFKVASDLSAPAQLAFMETVEQLASQLRTILLHQGRIIKIEKNHVALWRHVSGQPVGFVDGGMANLAMIGAAPVAVRVGGYIVTPGDNTPEREKFVVLKKLISELYAGLNGGVYDGAFPDYGALRDAARISVEAAGGVHVLQEHQSLKWLFLHGALVNPVSRYTDVMRDGKPLHRFPNFSADALKELLPPSEPVRVGLNANFVSVYLRQLQLLQETNAVVCGVVERESHTTSVITATIGSLHDPDIQPLLPMPAAEWKRWFLASIDPREDEHTEGPRITDPLLFRCLLEPGEALLPVPINRNDMRRAPQAWASTIIQYPQPAVSYLQPTEWTAPIRIELFEKDLARFQETATLILHCALLLPRYAFPVGLDIVDKFAKIPNWMSRPINTHTAVQALRGALDRGDTRLFDALRRMLCGSEREWLLRPRAL